MGSLIWGTYTWYLFHAMAEKINIKYFDEEKENIINHIKSICSVLPCPKCVNHAKICLKYIDNVKTKDELRIFLYDFHNKVNKRRSIHDFDILKLKVYEKLDFSTTIPTWTKHFKVHSNVPTLMNNTIFRNTIIKKFINYIYANLHKFS